MMDDAALVILCLHENLRESQLSIFHGIDTDLPETLDQKRGWSSARE